MINDHQFNSFACGMINVFWIENGRKFWKKGTVLMDLPLRTKKTRKSRFQIQPHTVDRNPHLFHLYFHSFGYGGNKANVVVWSLNVTEKRTAVSYYYRMNMNETYVQRATLHWKYDLKLFRNPAMNGGGWWWMGWMKLFSNAVPKDMCIEAQKNRTNRQI